MNKCPIIWAKYVFRSKVLYGFLPSDREASWSAAMPAYVLYYLRWFTHTGGKEGGGRKKTSIPRRRERERRSHFTGKEALCVGGRGEEIGHVRLALVQNGGKRTVRRLAGGEKYAGEHNFIFPRQYADILDKR